MADESWSKVRLPDHTARLVGEYKGIFGKEASAESSLKRKEAAIDLSKGMPARGVRPDVAFYTIYRYSNQARWVE